MVEYYKDNPNVTVIVDRREGPDRRDVKPDGRTERAPHDPRPSPAPRRGHLPGDDAPDG